MTAATRTRRPSRPLTCTTLARPVCSCEMFPQGKPGLVVINCDEYQVGYIAELPESGEPVVYGYDVEKVGDPTSSYDLPADAASCECMGYLRWGHCKHQAACRHVFAI